MTSKRLALFDLDHTLLPLDSDYQWAVFMAKSGRAGDPVEALRRNEELMDRYNAGELTAEQAAEFMLGLLAAHPAHLLAAWHEEFMQKIIRPAMTQQAIELVQQHLAAGDLCAVVTATNSFVTAPIARAFGVPTLIATDPEYIAGRYTGKILGTPSFKHGKVVRVNQWLAGRDLRLDDFDESYFYSDSINDLPLLDAVTHPIVTNPSESLLAIAQQRNWPVLNLFNKLADDKS
ncbi:MAG: HAD-IB family hydrolase [Burkholderiaceae bacterium]|jgi:HAD superfamily hydrolase (TIGR01490 family)|nr:HAD-IB family hydrolase [Burkholderiaceae bacterium]MDP4969060.1 HAD-IB family hydrolase [Burkholderiaceae bacterium]MDP5111067.1 HAD-IB family hydrolase [Burkholderiaceae bacterium]